MVRRISSTVLESSNIFLEISIHQAGLLHRFNSAQGPPIYEARRRDFAVEGATLIVDEIWYNPSKSYLTSVVIGNNQELIHLQQLG